MSKSIETMRRRRGIALVTGGVVASAALALSMTGTMSAFVASITNSTNTAATGALVMEEKNGDGSVTCTSTDGGGLGVNQATCSTINKFGGSTTMSPGRPVTSNVTLKNTGTMAASTFSLTPGTCTQSANGVPAGTATDLCSKLNVKVTSDSSTVFEGTLAALEAGGPISLAAPVNAGTSVPFTFDVTLDSGADNTYQGLLASMPLTWTFTA